MLLKNAKAIKFGVNSMPYLHLLPEDYQGITIEKLKDQLSSSVEKGNALFKIIDKFDMSSPKDLGEIYQHIYAVTRLALMERGFLENKERLEFDFYNPAYERLCTKDFPCKIVITNDAFIVKTPLTIGRFNSSSKKVQRQNYQIKDYIQTALAIEKEKNEDELIRISNAFSGNKLACIVIRKTAFFNFATLCDNDNIEDGRIINVICQALKISDNCLKMDLIKSWKEAENDADIGTEIIVTLLKNEQKYR